MSLYNIPTEILLKIFNYLDEYSLTQLACVCKRINLLLFEILDKKSNHLLVTNQASKKFRERCKPLISSYSSKFITHYNWMNEKCIESKIYEKPRDFPMNYIPNMFSTTGLELNQNRLLFFHSSFLYAYDRAEDGTVKRHKKNMIIQRCDSAIFDIVSCNDVIISAHVDGSIRHWRIEPMFNKNYFFIKLLKIHANAHNSIVRSVSATSQYIASGSQRGSIKIHKNIHDNFVPVEGNKIFRSYDGKVASIAFDPTESKLAASINHYNGSSSYIIYDVNKSHLGKIYAQEFRCSQLMWENPYTILACCERSIKKMDLRTPNLIVCRWNTRHGKKNNLSCMSSDNMYTIITGTYCNQVVLWDQREISHRKIYNMYDFEDGKSERWKSEIIHSVGFDSCHLYCASYECLHEFDFKGDLDL